MSKQENSGLNPPAGGFLISVEGIDGTGKSSLVHALSKKLDEYQLKTFVTKEPGATNLGRDLRVILHERKEDVCDTAEFLLFAADRAQHFFEMIIPQLEAGTIIISDRMNDSSVAYQGFGRGLDIPMIKAINKWAMCNIEPDLIFYIELDFKTALERIMLRGGKLTSFEKEQELFWKRVNDGFKTIFKDRTHVVVLDGKKTLEELTEIATQKVLELVK